MKKPNGYGSVYRLKDGKRRKPWVARKTVGWKDNGQPVYIFLGRFSTRLEAETALAAYNTKPYDRQATFGAVLDLWKERCLPSLSPGTQNVYASIYPRVAPLKNIPIAEIRLNQLQSIADHCTHAVGKSLKNLLGQVFALAVKHEILTPDRRDLVHYIELSQDKGKTLERRIFTAEEIVMVKEPEVKILLYTGLRVGELIALQPEDIHLEERWIYIRHSKTEAGIRTVPIAEKIVPCFQDLPSHLTYPHLHDTIKAYGGHRPHDTRHTFISLCADHHIDERITKAIVGHAGSGITETVYTHLNLQTLLDAVNTL